MSKFKIGEVVIMNSSLDAVEHNGKEVTIEEVKIYWDGRYYYDISPDYSLNGYGFFEAALRKKKPPAKQETCEWSECAWRPEDVTA